MNVNLYTWFDTASGRTKFRIICPRCGHKFHICTNPRSAWRAASKKGYDMETGLCKVCRLMDSMAALVEREQRRDNRDMVKAAA